MNRIKEFTTANPTGAATGMEPVRLDVLKAAVENKARPIAAVVAAPEPFPLPTPSLTAKNLRLPADLVEFIDYVYTKDHRMRKQDAYTQALEAYFRPLMRTRSPQS